MGKKVLILAYVSMNFFLAACGNDESSGGGMEGGATVPLSKISANGAADSHTDIRQTQNCMQCHKAGNNPYVYQIAGSVWSAADLSTSYADAVLTLKSGPKQNDEVLLRLEVDANGNFYSTEAFDFSQSVYPFIEGIAGEKPLHMSNFVAKGECNGCHGNSTLPIYIGTLDQVVVDRISKNGAALSHTDERRGLDCTQCHAEYTLAGTVFNFALNDYYPDAKLYLYSQANGAGDLVKTVEVDANGNFYTTEPVDFGSGLYPVLESAAGNYREYMSTGITQGACAACHGVSTLPLFIAAEENERISRHGANNSHTDARRGQDCMQCHSPGNNSIVYSVAGTVYQADDPSAVFPNASVNLYSKANAKGELIATLEVDANGNFYTTEPLDVSAGVYPSVNGGGVESLHYMSSVTTQGSCNGCHDGVKETHILLSGAAVQLTSAHGTSYSHTDGRRGVDCLGCHRIGGNNPYQYSVAGTVYDIDLLNFYPNASISLYSGPGKTGDLVATIEVDANGNFYTTDPIDLGKGRNGIYASIVGSQPTSPIIEMITRTDNGGCSNSSCHGVTRPPIYAVD